MGHNLAIENVSKSFGNIAALADIDLKIEEGSFVCLLGPSGCGKTTLLRIIAGFEKADSGRLILDGADITTVPPHRRGFGMVFQSLALFPHMSVADNIAYGLKLRRVEPAKRRDRVEELLAVIELPSIADRPVSALSGGQRQRVAIARALAVQPKLFLLDEPLSALDAKLRDNMQIELRQLQRKFGVTTVLVTHDQTEAMMLADELVVMKDGKVRQIDDPSMVYREPVDAFVADFLGAANIVPGMAGDGGRINLLGVDTTGTTTLKPGTGLDIAIRAEQIGLAEPTETEAAARPIGTIAFMRDLGEAVELIVTVGDERLRVRSAAREAARFAVDDKVELNIDPEQCCVFERRG